MNNNSMKMIFSVLTHIPKGKRNVHTKAQIDPMKQSEDKQDTVTSDLNQADNRRRGERERDARKLRLIDPI